MKHIQIAEVFRIGQSWFNGLVLSCDDVLYASASLLLCARVLLSLLCFEMCG